MKNFSSKKLAALLLFWGCCLSASAQYTFTGQLRTRTELRDGFGNLPNKDKLSPM